MLPPEQPERIRVAFDDHRLVANAGLLLPVVRSHRLSPGGLLESFVDLGNAPGRANAGDKLLTLVTLALPGVGYINDADGYVPARAQGAGLHGLGVIHPWDFPAEFPVGSTTPVRADEPFPVPVCPTNISP